MYLIKRVVKSYAGKHGLSKLRSFEIDLSKLQFRIGTTAAIHRNNGEILTGDCDIPMGFAGDPDKNKRVIEKFERECQPVYGKDNTAFLLQEIITNGLPDFKKKNAILERL